MSEAPIGIFDSGIGGLTVWRALHRLMPHESLCYLGDTARVPYGNKSPETVTRYSIENAEFLMAQGVKAIVVACNTSSALSLSTLVDRCSVPVIGVIQPGVEAALRASKNRKIGVIGTAGTIASEAYARSLTSGASDVQVVSQACPLFVSLVEEGWLDGEITTAIIRRYLSPVMRAQVDTLILGCTHYPVLAEAIQAVVGPDIRLIDSGEATAMVVQRLLTECSLLATPQHVGASQCHVTDNSPQFAQVAQRILGDQLPPVTVMQHVG